MDNQLTPEKPWFVRPKIIFIILGAVIAVELILAIRALNSPPSSAQSIIKPVVLSGGKISLNTPKKILMVKEVVPVSINIDTGGHVIDGADVIIHFDPKILEATSAGIVKGKIFDEYPAISIDPDQGLISLSGINNLKKGFNGKGEFALLNLRTKIKGSTSLVVDFKKNQTTDSNLVEASSSKDILEEVGNLELVVK